MTQPTLLVKDANSVNQTVFTHNPNGAAVVADSQPVNLATDHPAIKISSRAGVGGFTSFPTTSANGVAIGSMPVDATGVRIYLKSSDSVTFTISSTAPNTPPTKVFTITTDTTGPNWDENLSNGQMIYVTSVTGTPIFRWI